MVIVSVYHLQVMNSNSRADTQVDTKVNEDGGMDGRTNEQKI